MQSAVSNDQQTPWDKLAAAFPQLGFQNLSTGQVRVESSEPLHAGPLVRFLGEQGVEVMAACRMRPSLEGVFVQITGILRGAFNENHTMLLGPDFWVLGAFCIFLFAWSLRNVRSPWILQKMFIFNAARPVPYASLFYAPQM